MYRGAGGYWRTYSYLYYVHVYIQGCWRGLESGEHTAINILYMCMYRGAGGYWRTYSAPDLATPQAFSTDPSLGTGGT